ncbi:MAG: prepilin peptidase [Bacilli bacterium]|nr:prepilin peptidase [Bacilli bacterium]
MNTTYYIIAFFIFGIMFGSFYNVVGYRLPRNESIVFPNSYCPKCKKPLGFFELVPIFSYIFLLGRCKKCKTKISFLYPLFELLTGLLFVTCYLVFGISLDLIIALIFSSALIIIVIGDINYMTIPDEIIIIASVLIIILKLISSGFYITLISIGEATLTLAFMYLLKKVGDFMFKKESLGGGDIKLMFLIGLVVGLHLGVLAVVLAAFIALPISLLILIYKKTNIISFGPFLSIAGLIYYFLQITPLDIYKLILNI